MPCSPYSTEYDSSKQLVKVHRFTGKSMFGTNCKATYRSDEGDLFNTRNFTLTKATNYEAPCHIDAHPLGDPLTYPPPGDGCETGLSKGNWQYEAAAPYCKQILNKDDCNAQGDSYAQCAWLENRCDFQADDNNCSEMNVRDCERSYTTRDGNSWPCIWSGHNNPGKTHYCYWDPNVDQCGKGSSPAPSPQASASTSLGDMLCPGGGLHTEGCSGLDPNTACNGYMMDGDGKAYNCEQYAPPDPTAPMVCKKGGVCTPPPKCNTNSGLCSGKTQTECNNSYMNNGNVNYNCIWGTQFSEDTSPYCYFDPYIHCE